MVGTLDLNQCIHLPDEITGMKPQVESHYYLQIVNACDTYFLTWFNQGMSGLCDSVMIDVDFI